MGVVSAVSVDLSLWVTGCRRKQVRMEAVRGRSKDDRGGAGLVALLSYTTVRNQCAEQEVFIDAARIPETQNDPLVHEDDIRSMPTWMSNAWDRIYLDVRML